jgi:Uma2 family endonuclease
MIQALRQPVTFDEIIEWYPENSEVRYELHQGVILEVVSLNWRDDYFKKFADYEALGIQEYWIVDYAALGGRRFLGNPKQPTLFVCSLVDGEYDVQAFRGSDRIFSPTFPELTLTAAQVFAAQS